MPKMLNLVPSDTNIADLVKRKTRTRAEARDYIQTECDSKCSRGLQPALSPDRSIALAD